MADSFTIRKLLSGRYLFRGITYRTYSRAKRSQLAYVRKLRTTKQTLIAFHAIDCNCGCGGLPYDV